MMPDTTLIILLLIILFCTGILFGSILLVSRDTSKIGRVELLLDALTKESHAPVQEKWVSSDGRYEAESFEMLLLQMINDPDTPLSTEQVAVIRTIFTDFLGDSPEQDEESA